jgi:hypothetical protein
MNRPVPCTVEPTRHTRATNRTATLIALALCLAPAVGMAATATGATPSFEDDGLGERNLWPIYERAKLANGNTRRMCCYLWTWTTRPDGTTSSYSVLNWIDSDGFTAALPLYYRSGTAERRTTLVIPLWYQGRDAVVVPPLLTASWKRAAGGRTTWVTPLLHVSTDASGSLTSMHAGPYVQDGSFRMLFPIVGAGQDTWVAPLLLSGGGRRSDGGSRLWVTPLFHRDALPDGRTDHLHVLNYLHWGDQHAILPVAWWGGRSWGALPLAMGGEGWWVSPPALSTSWRNESGGRTTWITPLAHVATDGRGDLATMHVGPYVHTPGADVVFPLFWSVGQRGSRSQILLPLYYAYGPADRRTQAIIPLWFRDPSGWVVPPALTAAWTGDDGGRNLWITPLFHAQRSQDRQRAAFHAGLWFRGRSPAGSYDVGLPVYYRKTITDQAGERTHVGVLPAWVSGPGYAGSPALLSAWWRRAAGGGTTWVTPFFHRSTRADGTLDGQHVGPLVTGSVVRPDDAAGKPNRTDYAVLFPLYYHRADTAGGTTRTHAGAVPFWFSGPDYALAPLALSGRWANAQGGHTTWITPLVHRTTDGAGTVTSQHLGPYLQSGDTHAVLPIAWWSGQPGRRSVGILPLWFQGPDYRAAPLALSWWTRRTDGSSSLWITPMFHEDRDAAGALRHRHVGPLIQTPSTTVVLPSFYRHTAADGVHWGLFPAWFVSRQLGLPVSDN